MEIFLLLIRKNLKTQPGAIREHFYANIPAITRWVGELAETGNYIAGEPLNNSGNHVTRDCISWNGPFIEAKEAVSAYVLIRGENVNQAGAIAQSCLVVLNGRIVIEVRPIIETSYD